MLVSQKNQIPFAVSVAGDEAARRMLSKANSLKALGMKGFRIRRGPTRITGFNAFGNDRNLWTFIIG